MFITPINYNIATVDTKYQQNKNIKHSKKLFFTAKDSFNMDSIVECQLSTLTTKLDTEIRPYFTKNKNKYLQLAKIGYDSQEKLKIISSYETKLMHKKLNALDNPNLKHIQNILNPYEEFQNNIKEFERTNNFVRTHPIYATAQILNTIEKSRAKIYKDREEFEKLTPLYKKFSEIKITLDKDLSNIASKNMPNFSKKIQQLNNQNKEAVLLFMISDFQECSMILKDYDSILADYKNKNQPPYQIYERIEKLNYKINNLLENPDKKQHVTSETEKFLEKHKNYEKENLSRKEIEKTYNQLLKNTDYIINQKANELTSDLENYQTKISPRISDRALKAQAKIIKNINYLIQKEKEKFYANSSNVQF